jgi:hypothetical protein
MRPLISATLVLALACCSAARGPQLYEPFVPKPEPDYAGHLEKLRQIIPAEKNFTYITVKPFQIITDLDAADIPTAQRTVTWAMTHLMRDFFDHNPDRVIDIFIFKNKDSYIKNSREILHRDPPDEFGFTDATTIAVNWATGGGSLVREMVHPYIATNFPNCPPWFEHGLASLYEQSTAKDGHIIGMTNWRLKLLQETLRGRYPREEGPAPSFQEMCRMDAATFLGKSSMPNTNTARYLLLYLQEKNQLFDLYRAMKKNLKEDPTGYTTLQNSFATVGETDIAAFRKKWENWVLTLTYP